MGFGKICSVFVFAMMGLWGVLGVQMPSHTVHGDIVVNCGIVCTVVLGCMWLLVVRIHRCGGVVGHYVGLVWNCVVVVVDVVVTNFVHKLCWCVGAAHNCCKLCLVSGCPSCPKCVLYLCAVWEVFVV